MLACAKAAAFMIVMLGGVRGVRVVRGNFGSGSEFVSEEVLEGGGS